MGKRIHPLDAKIAVIDLFESGKLSGPVTTDQIADAVGEFYPAGPSLRLSSCLVIYH